jgi:hypothetical protein
MFEPALAVVLDTTSPRAWAFTLLGIHSYLIRFPNDLIVKNIGGKLAERLVTLYRTCSAKNWSWFEDTVSYSNAHLPHALLLASQWMGQEDYAKIGFESLEWLVNLQTSPEGYFTPIGSNGFYRRGEQRTNFDQQPVEAGAMVSACLEAYRMTDHEYWLAEAQRIFGWYLGANELGIPLYDAKTGGCFDGLHPDRVNRNQGAESTLSFLLALVDMTTTSSADQYYAELESTGAKIKSETEKSTFSLLPPKPTGDGNGRSVKPTKRNGYS